MHLSRYKESNPSRWVNLPGVETSVRCRTLAKRCLGCFIRGTLGESWIPPSAWWEIVLRKLRSLVLPKKNSPFLLPIRQSISCTVRKTWNWWRTRKFTACCSLLIPCCEWKLDSCWKLSFFPPWILFIYLFIYLFLGLAIKTLCLANLKKKKKKEKYPKRNHPTLPEEEKGWNCHK